MNRPGHYGLALLSYAPIAIVVGVAIDPSLVVVGGVLTLGLSMVPDYDQRIPLLAHRGPTHSLTFAVLVGGALAAVTATVVNSDGPEAVMLVGTAFLIGSVAVVSHVVGDVLTPAGVRPLWPVTDRGYTLAVVRSGNVVVNYGLLAAGIVAFTVAMHVVRSVN